MIGHCACVVCVLCVCVCVCVCCVCACCVCCVCVCVVCVVCMSVRLYRPLQAMASRKRGNTTHSAYNYFRQQLRTTAAQLHVRCKV